MPHSLFQFILLVAPGFGHRHAGWLPMDCVRARLLQSCPTLCDPVDCSLPGFSVHGILQARVLERVAMPSSRGSSQYRDQTASLVSPALAGGFFTTGATWKDPNIYQWNGGKFYRFLFSCRSWLIKFWHFYMSFIINLSVINCIPDKVIHFLSLWSHYIIHEH